MDLKSKNKILFVFEGQKTEPAIHNKIKECFFSENTIITCVFGTVIYALYKDLKQDEDLEVFSLLKNRISALENHKKNEFSQIYLFFDYERHATNASDEKLENLLEIFDDETENGKLYLSYPMVEALKHYKDFESFKNITAICSENYKKEVNDFCKNNETGLIDFNQYDKTILKELITAHLCKMNYIVNDDYSFPTQIHSQLEIFNYQKAKSIDKNNGASVLSAFPIFIHDYFGNEQTKNKLSQI